MATYEFLDHTADIGIRLIGKDLTDIFVTAAGVMFNIIADLPTSSRSIKKSDTEIKVSADSREELLVAWLGELLSLADCNSIFFTDFCISEISDNNLAAKVSGIPMECTSGKTEIKAVTRHNLAIYPKKENQLCAEVFFDV